MKPKRFIAPSREAIHPNYWRLPLFDSFAAHRDWFEFNQWPTLAELNHALADSTHPVTGQRLEFAEQTAALLLEGCHYERRIFDRGQIATRSQNWHDLFNAAVWVRSIALKAAMNARQVEDLTRVGKTLRTRGQCALTQFDEAGVIVSMSDPALLALWDVHDWHGLFWRERAAWHDGRISVQIVGHALLEHALAPGMLLVGKCLVVDGNNMRTAEDVVARKVLAGEALLDPQELRPLPLSGIPGWHRDTDDENFYRNAPCFQPVRTGRVYPSPLAAAVDS